MMVLKVFNKKLLSVVLVLILAVSAIPLGAFTFDASASTSGTTGDCTWSISGTTLTISGNGAMDDYTFGSAPWYYNNITRVVIKSGVTNIGECAFEGSDIKTVTIPNTVISIGDSAFNNCHSFTNVTIPNSVTTIGDEAFFACDLLTNITIPDSVIDIGYSAFSCCSSLKSISIPNSVKSIKDSTFSCCDGLTNVYISNGVTSIGIWAFSGCTSLTTLDFPDSVESIDTWAFQDCSNLTTVSFGEGINTINPTAFENCTKLKNITIPEKELTIGENAFLNTAYYNDDSNWENDVLYIGKHLIEARETISGDYSVKDDTINIAVDAFRDCINLNFVTLPDNVMNIGSGAFYNCTALTDIAISEKVKTIGGYAFQFCTSLTEIYIPESVTSIEQQLFYGCSSLKSIVIPDSVTSIGDSAFIDCTSLTTVMIGDCVTTIGRQAFLNCTNLKSITVPVSVASIGKYAFIDCNNLTDVWYKGDVADRDNITIDTCNDELLNASWHYNSCPVGAPHTESENVVENLVEATCTENGSCDEVVYCYVCDEELSRETIVLEIDIDNHINTELVYREATCTESEISYEYCIDCFEILSYYEGPATGHTPDAPVQENIVSGTCVIEGSCDNVVYCIVCKAEVSRERVTIGVDDTNHVNTTRYDNDSCVNPGYYIQCDDCGEIVYAISQPVIRHDYVIEVIEPTCTNEGYTIETCPRCGDSLIYNYTSPIGHTEKTAPAVAPTYDSTGLTEGKICTVCGETIVAPQTVPALDEAITFTYKARGVGGADTAVNSGYITLDIYMNVNTDIARLWGINLGVDFNKNLTLTSVKGCIFEVSNYTNLDKANSEGKVILVQDMFLSDDKTFAKGEYLFATLTFSVNSDFYYEEAAFNVVADNCEFARGMIDFVNELTVDYGTGTVIDVVMLGDSNGDGKHTVNDTMALSKWYDSTDNYNTIYDMDKDGYLTMADLALIRAAVAGNDAYLDY